MGLFLKINLKLPNVIDLNKCLQQIKLPILLNAWAPVSNISAMNIPGVLDLGIFWLTLNPVSPKRL